MAKDERKDKDAAGKPPAASKKAEGKVVQVRATRLGFYGHMLRQPKKIFNVQLAPGEKMPSWVELVREEPAAGEQAGEEKAPASEESKDSSSDNVI